jgi:hypothetical protein
MNETYKTKAEKREHKKRKRIPMHGRTIGQVYKNAIEKRTKKGK